MIIDARSLPDGEVIDADICIVGGGPAGITLALELSGSPLKVALIESGGIYYEDETQQLYKGPNVGFQYDPLDEARLRFLGGSSNHWSGHAMRLAPVDFEVRDWMKWSGWPITYEDIAPFYDRAQPYFELHEERPYDIAYWADRLGFDLFDLNPDLLENVSINQSPPTAFGYTYEDALRASENVTVFLNANALNIDSTSTASEVTGIDLACIDGPRLRCEAKRYVLCMGGIEIPRLMLLSNKVHNTGIGNGNDLVGRFFADHAAIRPAARILAGRTAPNIDLYAEPYEFDDVGGMFAAIVPSDDLLRREQIASFIFHMFPAARSPGDLAIGQLTKQLRGKGNGLAPHIQNVLTDLDGAVNGIWRRALDTRDDLITREWVGPWLGFECVPNYDSTVHLVEETDRFGQRQIALNWQLTDQEMRTVKRATELLASEISRTGAGRVWTDVLSEDYDWPSFVARGKHHCGTTRMSAGPDTGVVNADCQVHGISNLFISSSSVFPTNGYANPTVTIAALSIRMADKFKADARAGTL
ncbi:GMC family oxidoreductase [Shimia sp. R9_3]|uniref:GMC oxidoreductase n=1 Tax=Shimia sp. R9_3 TaxID=2821113 RepID=UPI001ADB7C63|nr:GMC family oxidoreductase [Shimia sp. R9_3]MBO9402576.1 GMC family oxidoreductase [Shimia sp. R9_3]